MNTADVAHALNLDLDAINKRLHDPAGPHAQDIETVLYALHSLRTYIDPPAMRAFVPGVPQRVRLRPGERIVTAAEIRAYVTDAQLNREYNSGQEDSTTRAILDDHRQARTPG